MRPPRCADQCRNSEALERKQVMRLCPSHASRSPRPVLLQVPRIERCAVQQDDPELRVRLGCAAGAQHRDAIVRGDAQRIRVPHHLVQQPEMTCARRLWTSRRARCVQDVSGRECGKSGSTRSSASLRGGARVEHGLRVDHGTPGWCDSSRERSVTRARQQQSRGPHSANVCASRGAGNDGSRGGRSCRPSRVRSRTRSTAAILSISTATGSVRAACAAVDVLTRGSGWR